MRSTAYPSVSVFGMKLFRAFLIIPAVVITNSVQVQTQASTSQAGGTASQVTTLKAEVRLVELDVLVTDSHGRPVTGLAQDDFKIEEDHTPQPVRTFDVHTLPSESPNAASNIPPLPPNTYLNLVNAPESGTPTVILYDALNTLPANQSYGHAQLLDFLKHRRPGTQIAIFVLTNKLHLLQGFTQDTGLLTAALTSKRGGPQSTAISPRGNIGSTADSLVDDVDLDAALTKMRDMDNLGQQRLQDDRVEATVNALTDIGRFLESLPGRKDLIWLSSAFPSNIFRDPTITAQDPTDARPPRHDESVRNYSQQIKQATDLLNLSHVSVYPVDIRGITLNPDLDASSGARFAANPAMPVPSGVTPSSRSVTPTRTNTLYLSRQEFSNAEEATRTTMDTIADNTGGHAFYGSNGLKEAFESAITSGSTYYSLTYSPTNPKYDGSLRHIKVTLKKPGYTLSYRKTYYADDLEAAARAAADAPQSPLTPALERGTPLSHGLFLEAHLEADGPPAAATPAQMEVLAQYEAMRTKKNAKPAPVMMQQYVVSYGLIARQLEMPEDDKGIRQASLEFGVIAYDEDGRKLSGLDTRIDDTIPADRYPKLAEDGYHAVQSIAVPVTAKLLRLAVRDASSNRVGSLEVRLPLAGTADAKSGAAR